MLFFFAIKKLIKILILSILFYFDIDIGIKFWLIFRSLQQGQKIQWLHSVRTGTYFHNFSSLHRIHEQRWKLTKQRNLLKMRIVSREWFTVIYKHFAKNFFEKRICQGRRSLDEHKAFFLCSKGIHKNCCRWQIACKRIFIMFRKIKFFSQKSGSLVVCEQRRVICSRLLFFTRDECKNEHTAKNNISLQTRYVALCNNISRVFIWVHKLELKCWRSYL